MVSVCEMTSSEAAEELGVSSRMVRKYVAKQCFAACKAGTSNNDGTSFLGREMSMSTAAGAENRNTDVSEPPGKWRIELWKRPQNGMPC